MISIVYCTKEHNQAHIDHLKKACGHPKVEIIEYINKGEGLTKFYKKGLAEAKHDIVVFCHDDIIIETKQIAKKLTRLYDKNPEYGVLGVAGSKQMGTSAKWWENQKKMYGRVAHTKDGKTWLSSYSPDQGNDLEEVVIVDGVFFSVHKGRIKEDFNLDVTGFHFYDVDFSFRNHIAGVKIGVHTNIRVNHMSIGETNDEWEKNRVEFAEKHKDNLPVNIKRVVKDNERIKVLIGCLSFANLTGSEMYVFELAKELVKQNCDVSICSQLGDPLSRKAHSLGIKLYNVNEPPGFKLGDGKWQIQTQQGLAPSEDGKLYQIGDPNFDVLHLNHKPITEHLIKLYPGVDTICTIHSEVLDLELPVISDQIKKYVAIRPEIKEFIVENHGIPSDKVDVIYNPIDYNRFKVIKTQESDKRDNKRIIFVGTLDYLRKNTLLDLIETTRNEGNDLWLVGKENGVTVDELKSIDGKDCSHITYQGPTANIERLIQDCDETAGILLGRTTIEGWLCGKEGWIYDVDKSGTILSKELHEIPLDIEKFRSDVVAKEMIMEYKEIID